MTSFNTKTLTQIGLAALAAVATLAHAGDAPQIKVKYADLNVSSPVGAAVLLQRITSAATQVCGGTDERELARLARDKACRDQAVAAAVAAVGSDALTRVYAARTGNIGTPKLAAN